MQSYQKQSSCTKKSNSFENWRGLFIGFSFVNSNKVALVHCAIDSDRTEYLCVYIISFDENWTQTVVKLENQIEKK